MKNISVRKRSIYAKEFKVGYSWTLATVLGEALLKAEEFFGCRDKRYTLLGIDYAKKGGSWFPGNCKHIIIHLSQECLTDRQDAYLQLSHATIHLLSPTGKRSANNLEEGLAHYFSAYYMNSIFGDGWWHHKILSRNHRKAFQTCSKLLSLDKDAIKKLREIQPTISKITSDQILNLYPTLPKEDADFLSRKFGK